MAACDDLEYLVFSYLINNYKMIMTRRASHLRDDFHQTIHLRLTICMFRGHIVTCELNLNFNPTGLLIITAV